mgnify:CR=1 FL=1
MSSMSFYDTVQFLLHEQADDMNDFDARSAMR